MYALLCLVHTPSSPQAADSGAPLHSRPASEIPLDAMTVGARKGAAIITGRNYLVLDWIAGAAKKVFRRDAVPSPGT